MAASGRRVPWSAPAAFEGGSEILTRFLPRSLDLPAALLVTTLLVVVCAGVRVAQASAAGGPISVRRPVVTGPALAGKRVTAWPGRWSASGRARYRYQWYRCDTMGGQCSLLQGVTGRRRLLGGKDVGHTLSLAVHATDSTGSTTAYASLIGPVGGAPALLVSTVQPAVSGAAEEGGTLAVDTGSWRPQPSSFSYQWARCNGKGRVCAPITGATTASHEVGADDLGHILVAIVQARAGATLQAVFSAATVPDVAPVPVGDAARPLPTVPPLVGQVVQEGKLLMGAGGSWSGSGAIGYAYQWYRCDPAGAHCKSIRGATKTTYLQTARDVGQTLGFGVRATNGAGKTSAYANLIGPVAGAAATLVSSAQPAVSGTASPGQTLQVTTGNWSVPPSSFGYQWQRCNVNGRLCAAIAGATSSSYIVAADDTGHRLLAVVRAILGTTTQDTLSLATQPVAPPAGPRSAVAPSVTGEAQAGKQLTGAGGTWSGSGTIGYAFQWYRCDPAGAHCKSIHGATKPTYTQVARDAGQTLGFAVRATDAAGTTSAYANLVGPVAGAAATLVSTVQPAVSGTASPGQTLQVTTGTWSLPPSSFGYQWQRCNVNGRLCAAIAGATSSSYVVAADDSGHTLLALVQPVSDAGLAASLSAATAPIP